MNVDTIIADSARQCQTPSIDRLLFINTAGDLTLLPRILDAARRFERRPSDEEMAKMVGEARITSLFGLPA